MAGVGISAVGHLCYTDGVGTSVVEALCSTEWRKWGLAYCLCLLAGVGVSTVAPLSSADRVVAYCCCMSETCGFGDRSVNIIKCLGRVNTRNQVLYALVWSVVSSGWSVLPVCRCSSKQLWLVWHLVLLQFVVLVYCKSC